MRRMMVVEVEIPNNQIQNCTSSVILGVVKSKIGRKYGIDRYKFRVVKKINIVYNISKNSETWKVEIEVE